MPVVSRLKPSERQIIIAQHLIGSTSVDIAAKIKRSPATIQRVISKFKRDTAGQITAELRQEFADYRKELEYQSVETLKLALTRGGNADYEVYKAAPIAIQCMKGLGIFEGDQARVGIQVTLMPPGSWQGEFATQQPQAAITASSTDK